ncbi:hypothetical protein D3C72_1915070 [compost metagenome]
MVRRAATAVVNAPVTVAASAVATAASVKTAVAAAPAHRVMANRVQAHLRVVRAAVRPSKLIP